MRGDVVQFLHARKAGPHNRDQRRGGDQERPARPRDAPTANSPWARPPARTTFAIGLERLAQAMKPIRSEIARFPYGPQTDTAEANRQKAAQPEQADPGRAPPSLEDAGPQAERSPER